VFQPRAPEFDNEICDGPKGCKANRPPAGAPKRS
jgi:hypothetical protein